MAHPLMGDWGFGPRQSHLGNAHSCGVRLLTRFVLGAIGDTAVRPLAAARNHLATQQMEPVTEPSHPPRIIRAANSASFHRSRIAFFVDNLVALFVFSHRSGVPHSALSKPAATL